MTITIPAESENVNFYINYGPLLEAQYVLELYSQHSNDNLVNIDISNISSNDRYTHFGINVEDIPTTLDIDGIYNYRVKDQDEIIDYGLIKLINKNNELDSISYQSDNEERKSRILYKPL
jgi:hypothetical protein